MPEDTSALITAVERCLLLALRVIRRGAPFLDAIGCTEDIGGRFVKENGLSCGGAEKCSKLTQFLTHKKIVYEKFT
jgi:hypothetical protein